MEQENKKTTNRDDSPAQFKGDCPQVFHDGACPLCRAEISIYRKAGARANFCDVSQDGAALPEGRTRQDMLARFHVRRPDGRLLSGAAAFAELWKATPGWRWLGHLMGTPPFVWIAEALYRVFLVIRPGVQALARRVARD